MRNARCDAARSRRPPAAGDAGFSTLEAVLVIPVVVLLTMISVQFVVLWHARNVTEAAARDGLRLARGYQATGAQGEAGCAAYLEAVAGRMLTDAVCSVARSTGSVTVTVHATVVSVIPFGDFAVEETATGPVEQFAGSG